MTILVALLAVVGADVAAIATDGPADQCKLPISERHGGWYCYGTQP